MLTETLMGGSGGCYSYRPVRSESIQYLQEWMMENNIPHPVPAEELHCTVIQSTTKLASYAPHPESIKILPSKLKVELLGHALAISFQDVTLASQYSKAISLGATMKYARFLPHITVSYRVPVNFSLWSVKPPIVPLHLDPEEHCQSGTQLHNYNEQFRVWMEDKYQITIKEEKRPISKLLSSMTVRTEQDLPSSVDLPYRVLRKPFFLCRDNTVLPVDEGRLMSLKNRYPEEKVSIFRVDLSSDELTGIFHAYKLAISHLHATITPK